MVLDGINKVKPLIPLITKLRTGSEKGETSNYINESQRKYSVSTPLIFATNKH